MLTQLIINVFLGWRMEMFFKAANWHHIEVVQIRPAQLQASFVAICLSEAHKRHVLVFCFTFTWHHTVPTNSFETLTCYCKPLGWLFPCKWISLASSYSPRHADMLENDWISPHSPPVKAKQTCDFLRRHRSEGNEQLLCALHGVRHPVITVWLRLLHISHIGLSAGVWLLNR